MFCLRSWPQINFARAIEMAQQWQRVMAPAQLTHAANRKDLFYASRCKHFAKHIIKWNTWNKSKSMKHSNAVLIQFNIFKLFISLSLSFYLQTTDPFLNQPITDDDSFMKILLSKVYLKYLLCIEIKWKNIEKTYLFYSSGRPRLNRTIHQPIEMHRLNLQIYLH